MRRFAALPLLLLSMTLLACGDDGSNAASGTQTPRTTAGVEGEESGGDDAVATVGECATGSPASGPTAVEVTLTEYDIAPQPAEVDPAPTLTFVVTNAGETSHEFGLVRGTIDQLYERQPDGSLPHFPAGRLLAHVRDIEPGDTCTIELELEAGTYAMFDNLVVDGTSHAAEGMVENFVVVGEDLSERGGPPPHAGGGPPGG